MTRLALVLIVLSCSPVPDPDDPKYERFRDLAVVVNRSCSGVIVSTHSVLTADHCIDPSNFVLTRSGQEYPASVLSEWVMVDLAELAVPAASWDRVAAPRDPVPGEPVVIIHHMSGGWDGVEAHIGLVSSGEATIADWTPLGGSSGSPVFGEDGALLCVVTSYGSETGVGYCAVVP